MKFVVDLRKRHRSVWPAEDQAVHDGHPNKLAKCHNWVALPFRHSFAFGKPLHVPRYLYLDLGRHMQRNIACFRLHAYKLRLSYNLKEKNMFSSAALRRLPSQVAQADP
eukprot:1070141-Pelagomonas_calceolata.AAC.1